MFKRISERGNRRGSAYALTTFARILPGEADALEAYLRALPQGAESPFAGLPMLHVARVQIFRDELRHQGPKQRHRDPLQHAHLVFTSTIDGDLDPYLEALARVPEIDEWWGRCAGYPGRADVAAFRAFIRSIQVRTSLFQSAIPTAKVPEILAALALREQILDFAVEAQGLDAAALKTRFESTF
jgi:hypothetical protein